jgi:hypothetical protein
MKLIKITEDEYLDRTEDELVTVADLSDQIGTSDRAILYCDICGGEYSANKGDYFQCRLDKVLTCCGEPMRLVRKTICYQSV